MSVDAHANFAIGAVATAPSPAASGTSLVVMAGIGALFPAVPFNATVWPIGVIPLSTNAEIIRVTNISIDTLTIIRAQEGTSARTIIVGDQIACTITNKVITDAESAAALSGITGLGSNVATALAVAINAPGAVQLNNGNGALLTGIGSVRVVYTSSTCTSDSTLVLTSPTVGSDQTTALQTILNLASTTVPLHVICDGAYAATQLRFHGNTRWTNLPGCGIVQRGSSNKPLITNYNQSASTVTDTQIVIEGGTFNGNKTNQGNWISISAGTPTLPFSVVGMYGVNYLTIKDCNFWSSQTYAVHISNCTQVTLHNLDVDVDLSAGTTIGQDGIHFNGPSSKIELTDIRITSYDDGLAINADDGATGNPVEFGGLVTFGAITDLVANGIVFRNCLYGGRVYSHTSLVDRVSLSNLVGSFKNYIWVIGDYVGTAGNIGSVSFTNVDMFANPSISPTGGGDATAAGFYIGNLINQLRFTNITRNKWIDTRPLFKFMATANVGQLMVDGLSIRDDNAGANASTGIFDVPSGANISYMGLNNVSWLQTYVGTGYLVANGGGVQWLAVNTYRGPTRIRTGGSAFYETGDGFTSTPAAVTVFQDLFTGTNGTALTAHTPNTGGAWSNITGTPTIQSNAAQVLVGTAAANDSTLYNGRFTLVFTPAASGLSQFILRRTDANNSIIVNLDGRGGVNFNVAIYDLLAGVATLRATSEDKTGLSNAAHTAVFIINGTNLSVLVDNGSSVASTNAIATPAVATGIGIGSAVGTSSFDSLLVEAVNFSQTVFAPQSFTATPRNGGSAPYFSITTPADVNLASGVESTGIAIGAGNRKFSTGNISTQREIVIAAPTYTFNASSVITKASTFSITGSPIAGTNATLTNPYALDIESGVSHIGGDLKLDTTIINYKSIATDGDGAVVVRKQGRVVAQSAAGTICAYTTPASDGTYEVSANLLITAATVVSTSLNCDYTDESNTARTMILPVTGLAGTFLAGGLVTTTGPAESAAMHIRTKASTVITLSVAAGTFTGVTFSAEGIIRQLKGS